MKQVLIIGEHELKESVVAQYQSHGGWCIREWDGKGSEMPDISDVDEFALLLARSMDDAIGTDNYAIKLLGMLAESYSHKEGTRPIVHLLLHSFSSLWMLRRMDLAAAVGEKFEVYPFTMEDVWAKNILCLHDGKGGMQGLDHKPVTLESNHTVHLVVFGISELADAVVENAILVAHYPNYVRNHALRTRITVIDDGIDDWRKIFVSHHKSLMDNSYYRSIDIRNKQRTLHRPMYEGQREDFVDVEWEFVKGSLHDVVVQDKLCTWASSENQVLTVVVANDDDGENVSQANIIADMLYECDVPIYVKQVNSAFANIIIQSPRMKNVVTIGMTDTGYDITVPLLKMAKRVKYVYDYCYQYNIESETEGCISAPSYIDDEEVEKHWLQEKKAVKRYSNICNAMTLSTKMRSLGHSAKEKTTFYAISRDEIELISRVEHNRWNAEELMLGFRPCTDDEQAEIEADISKKSEYKERLVHYDLRAYDDLRADGTGKNVNTYDLCLSASIPLIVYERKEERE